MLLDAVLWIIEGSLQGGLIPRATFGLDLDNVRSKQSAVEEGALARLCRRAPGEGSGHDRMITRTTCRAQQQDRSQQKGAGRAERLLGAEGFCNGGAASIFRVCVE